MIATATNNRISALKRHVIRKPRFITVFSVVVFFAPMRSLIIISTMINTNYNILNERLCVLPLEDKLSFNALWPEVSFPLNTLLISHPFLCAIAHTQPNHQQQKTKNNVDKRTEYPGIRKLTNIVKRRSDFHIERCFSELYHCSGPCVAFGIVHGNYIILMQKKDG